MKSDPAKVPLAAPPLYEQIKTRLRARILNGTYAAHSQMPSENDLCAMATSAASPVRQALGDLQKEGLVFKLHGKGTFVSKPKAFQNVARCKASPKRCRRWAMKSSTQLKHIRFIPAMAQIAQRPPVARRAKVAEIHRVRLNREPVSLKSPGCRKRWANASPMRTSSRAKFS